MSWKTEFSLKILNDTRLAKIDSTKYWGRVRRREIFLLIAQAACYALAWMFMLLSVSFVLN